MCGTAAGDIVRDLDGVLAQFDRVIGLEKLKALHVNDSLNPCGAHKDRHAQIGEGHIGAAAFARIAQHPVLAGLPKILETPNDDAGWAREIAFFKAAAAGDAPQKAARAGGRLSCGRRPPRRLTPRCAWGGFACPA